MWPRVDVTRGPQGHGRYGNRWRQGLPYLSVATLLSALYVPTLLPSVGYHMDTSKFGYLGQVLGTGHPPGEPLYLMLNAAWVQLLPAGDPAWRANLLSAVFAVLTCLVLVAVLRELGVGRWVAAAGAALVGVSRLFWQQSLVAEVYTLNALFVAVELWLLLAWLRTRRDGLLVAAIGAFVVSFSNHPTGLILLPGLAVFLLRTRGYRVLARARSVAFIGGCALLALSTYAYIVWRSVDPSTPYVELDIHDWESFWAGVTGQQYGDDTQTGSFAGFFAGRVALAVRQLWLQYFLLAAVGVWGVIVLARSRPHAATLTALWGLAVAAFATLYPVSDFEVFYLVAWMMLGLWIAVGTSDLLVRASRTPALRSRVWWSPKLPVVAAALVPLIVAAVNYPRVDFSDNHARARFSGAVDALPRNAVVFTPSYFAYHGLNYFLVPGGAGERRNQYAQMGSAKTDQAGRVTGIDRIERYCADKDPVRLERIRETISTELRVFVYNDTYASKVAAHGYPTAQVAGDLHRISCDRFGVVRAVDYERAGPAIRGRH